MMSEQGINVDLSPLEQLSRGLTEEGKDSPATEMDEAPCRPRDEFRVTKVTTNR